MVVGGGRPGSEKGLPGEFDRRRKVSSLISKSNGSPIPRIPFVPRRLPRETSSSSRTVAPGKTDPLRGAAGAIAAKI
jgi:hypothetical protein